MDKRMKYLALILFLLPSTARAQQPQSSTAVPFDVSANYVQGGSGGGYRPTAGSGLTLNIGPGTAFCNGSVVTYAGGTLSMSNTTNYVYLNTASSCVPASKTSAYTVSDVPIAIVVASGSVITSIADDRTMQIFVSPSSATPIRSFGTTFGDTAGSALSSGSVVYFTIPYACTIQAWNITVDAGTATFDIWKIATGTAIPTVTNTITASALPAIASGTAIHSTTLTAWTTSVSQNDIIGIQLKIVATAKFAELDIQCQ